MKPDITKLVADGFYKEALSFYFHKLYASSRPFPSLFKACGKLEYGPQGKMLHTHLIKTGFFSDVYSATALAAMYMKLRLFDDGLQVYDEMPEQNLVSLNAAISAFSQNGRLREAFWAFKDGWYGGFRPNSVSIASLLPACGSVRHATMMHCWALKFGVEKDVYVLTSLLTVYSKYRDLVLADKVFDEMPQRSLVSYNAYLSGLLKNGFSGKVLDVFKQMMECLGEKPNVVTFVSVLSACASLGHLHFGLQVHGVIEKFDFRIDTMVGTTLVDMYSKCRDWQRAYDVFEELNGNRNLITWNSMISGMMLNAQSEEALKLFEQLPYEGLKPDLATWASMISGFSKLGMANEAFKYFKRMQLAGVAPNLKIITSILPACSDLAALRSGKEIHGHVTRIHVGFDVFIATALINSYMECGLPSWARRVFDWFEVKRDDPAFWNAMISGYGRNGDDESAFEIFDQMLEERVQPNAATFLSILSACSHTGEVDKGWKMFRMMSTKFGLKPNPEHFSCMVDLLARCSRLEDAQKLVQELSEPSASVYATLLGACSSTLDVELGEEMARKLIELEPESPTPFVILSNIYAGLGRWKDVERIRGMIDCRRYKKLPGFSLIGVS
ncbi:hypothetical protein UlMin_041313 [Ulmus minor]